MDLQNPLNCLTESNSQFDRLVFQAMTRLHVTRLPHLRIMLNFRQIRKSYRVFTNILATGRLPFVSCLLFGTFNKSFIEKRKRKRGLVKIGMVLKKKARSVYFSNWVMLFDIKSHWNRWSRYKSYLVTHTLPFTNWSTVFKKRVSTRKWHFEHISIVLFCPPEVGNGRNYFIASMKDSEKMNYSRKIVIYKRKTFPPKCRIID